MANFNGYNQPESNDRSNDPDDTIGMEQINSQNAAETNPYLSPENGDKKPSLAKKIIIGGTAVALAVAVGVGVYSNKSETTGNDSEQTIEAPTAIDGSDNEQELQTDMIDVDNSQSPSVSEAAPTAEEDTSIIGDGSYIFRYSKKSSIPNIDSYSTYGVTTTKYLDTSCKEIGWSGVEQCAETDPSTVSSILANAMQSDGYSRVEAITAHDGMTKEIYPAAYSTCNEGDTIWVYCVYKGENDFGISVVTNTLDQPRYLYFDSSYVPKYDELYQIWQDNQDLVKEQDDDEAPLVNQPSSSTSTDNSSSSYDLGYELEDYGADDNPSAYDDGPQA